MAYDSTRLTDGLTAPQTEAPNFPPVAATRRGASPGNAGGATLFTPHIPATLVSRRGSASVDTTSERYSQNYVVIHVVAPLCAVSFSSCSKDFVLSLALRRRIEATLCIPNPLSSYIPHRLGPHCVCVCGVVTIPKEWHIQRFIQ